MAGVDHGGGIDAAAARWGGARGDWLDLSTGINPRPYPLPAFGGDIWTALPDRAAFAEAEAAARDIARNQRSEVVTHGRDGRIRSKDSYGNDPSPPKDREH